MRRLKKLLRWHEYFRSDSIPPGTASAPTAPSPEPQATTHARVAVTRHSVLTHRDGAHSATTPVADVMQAPYDLRSCVYEISTHAQYPEMIFAEPPTASYEQQRDDHSAEQYFVDGDQLGGHIENSDRNSEDAYYGEQLASMGFMTQDNRTVTRSRDSARIIHQQNEGQFMSTLRETSCRKNWKADRYSMAHSEWAIFDCAEIPAEEIAQPLVIPLTTPLLTTINELRRETSITDFGELESPSHKTAKLVSEASLCSSFTEDVVVEIGRMIAAYSSGTFDELGQKETSAPHLLSPEQSSPASFYHSGSVRNSSKSPPTSTPAPSFVVLETDSRSQNPDTPCPLTPKRLAPTFPVESHRQLKTAVASVYQPHMGPFLPPEASNRFSSVDEVETSTQSQWTPPIPVRSLARPKFPVHLAYLIPTAAAQAPVYISKKRIGPKFRGQWNVVDFGPVPKPVTRCSSEQTDSGADGTAKRGKEYTYAPEGVEGAGDDEPKFPVA